jgi:hypothetical protein
LEDQAAKHGLGSADLAARKLVLDALDSNDGDSIQVRLGLLKTEIEETRKDLSVATEALLVHGGRLGEKDANRWVTENLKER